MPGGDKLAPYRQKRDFGRTPEPPPSERGAADGFFMVHEHAARRPALRSAAGDRRRAGELAVPRGPSTDPADKRLAVHVEDHPLEYAQFEGTIPAGNYGAAR
jgi:bifunctional non-homologous end joining protein LigD